MRGIQLTLAVMAAPIIAPAAAFAEARPADASVQEQLRTVQAQIVQLQAQLNQLQARLVSQGAAQEKTAADAQAVSVKAEQALAAATAANAAGTKAASLPDPAKWVLGTKLSGRMYFNASHVSHKVNGSSTGNTDNGGGFNIKRFYLGVDHKFNDVFSANLTTDISAISGVGQSLYVKKAYLEAKLSPAVAVRLGSADMPWIPYAEGIYGYRHIEQTVSDRTRFGTSADWGVHVFGSVANSLISYQVSAVDGGGYRDPHFSRSVDLEGRLSIKYHGFNAAVGGYSGKLGRNVQGGAPLRTYNRFNALAAYQGKIADVPVTIGGEYFHASNKAFNTTAPIPVSALSDSSDGYSIFASVSPLQRWSLFGRYDWVNPSKDLNPAFKNTYFNLGVQYTPAEIINLALVYKGERAVNGAFATGSLQSGVIGCATTATIRCAGSGNYNEIGLYGQFRF